jgi:hypothetical protein
MEVTVERALELIYTHTKQTSLKIIPIENALGHVLAEDIIASHNLPPYDNSAMDGYAVKIEDSGKCVEVKETIFAGDDFHGELHSRTAIKIMTGAKIPFGTQCIVPIEDVKECDGGVLLPKNLTMSKHIRLAGEDIKKEIQTFESSQISIFENTAESKARNKSILWWVLNLSYEKIGDEYSPIFEGETFDSKLDLYDAFEEDYEKYEFILGVLRRFTYLTTLWFLGRANKESEFKYFDNPLCEEATRGNDASQIIPVIGSITGTSACQFDFGAVEVL